ncbi:MAG TPA: hypothetical protein VJZ06_06635 [Mobilitalea sp.]|nr:hypothetical protein [Mobilitalea sp.]
MIKNRIKRLMVCVLTVVMLGSTFSVAYASSEFSVSGKNKIEIGDDGIVGEFWDIGKKSITFSLTVPAGTTSFYYQDVITYSVIITNSDGKKIKTIKPVKSKEKRWSEISEKEDYIYTINTGVKLSKGTYKVNFKAKTNLNGIMKITTYKNTGGKINYVADENYGRTDVAVTKDKTYTFTITVPKEGQYYIDSYITPYSSDYNQPETKIKDKKGKTIATLKSGGSGNAEMTLKKGTYTIDVAAEESGILSLNLYGN